MSHTQGQLFAAGAVKIVHRNGRAESRRRRKAALYTRLVGEGTIRKDPFTGKMYQVNGGQDSFKRAYEWRCTNCGESWWASTATHRNAKATCGPCRLEAALEERRLPLGSLRSDRSDGYTQIKTADGWRQHHRIVMEQHLGRELDSDETVHHINGDRQDNSIDNLQLRQGHHGPGIAMICLDCGSSNVTPTTLAHKGSPQEGRGWCDGR